MRFLEFLKFFRHLYKDVMHMDAYAIIIVILFILLLMCFIKYLYRSSVRKNLKSNNLDLINEVEDLNVTNSNLLQTNSELYNQKVQCEQEIKSFKDDLLKVNIENEEYKYRQKELVGDLSNLESRLSEIHDKYSKRHSELMCLRNSMNSKDEQLYSFRLSPHFLKNVINNAMLGTKHACDTNSVKPSFSFFGKKFYSIAGMNSQLDFFREKQDRCLKLLIGVLEYLIYSTSADRVSLEMEMLNLRNFCNLLEMHKEMKIDIEKDIKSDDINIPPTILFNYLDNAVKHGYFKKRALKIKISTSDNVLNYSVETPLNPKKLDKSSLGGIGNNDFEDLLKRKNYNYTCSACDTKDTYIAKLQIKL